MAIGKLTKCCRVILLQSDFDYPDLDYPDFSIIRTCFSGQVFFNDRWLDKFKNQHSVRKLDLGDMMNLTGLSTQLSNRFMYFRHFSFQSHILSFSECLNAMLSVLVAGSERREDKNKETDMIIEGNVCKLRNLSHGPGQASVKFCLIHFKSGLLKQRMKSILYS